MSNDANRKPPAKPGGNHSKRSLAQLEYEMYVAKREELEKRLKFLEAKKDYHAQREMDKRVELHDLQNELSSLTIKFNDMDTCAATIHRQIKKLTEGITLEGELANVYDEKMSESMAELVDVNTQLLELDQDIAIEDKDRAAAQTPPKDQGTSRPDFHYGSPLLRRMLRRGDRQENVQSEPSHVQERVNISENPYSPEAEMRRREKKLGCAITSPQRSSSSIVSKPRAPGAWQPQNALQVSGKGVVSPFLQQQIQRTHAAIERQIPRSEPVTQEGLNAQEFHEGVTCLQPNTSEVPPPETTLPVNNNQTQEIPTGRTEASICYTAETSRETVEELNPLETRTELGAPEAVFHSVGIAANIAQESSSLQISATPAVQLLSSELGSAMTEASEKRGCEQNDEGKNRN